MIGNKPIGHGEIMEMAKEAEKHEAEKELRKLLRDYWSNQHLFFQSRGRLGGTGTELAAKLVAVTKYTEEVDELFTNEEFRKISEEEEKGGEKDAREQLEKEKVA